jgi:hypothetical protein
MWKLCRRHDFRNSKIFYWIKFRIYEMGSPGSVGNTGLGDGILSICSLVRGKRRLEVFRHSYFPVPQNHCIVFDSNDSSPAFAPEAYSGVFTVWWHRVGILALEHRMVTVLAEELNMLEMLPNDEWMKSINNNFPLDVLWRSSGLPYLRQTKAPSHAH